MEIITEEPLKIISQIFIPVILVFVTGIIQVFLKIYLSIRDKNKYIELLQDNFHSVEEFLSMVKFYKIFFVYIVSYLFFVLGVFIGFVIELALGMIIVNIFDYVLDINYIGKLLNLNSVNTLDVIAICYSCFNIGIILIIVFFIIWCRLVGLMNHLTPKIDEHGKIALDSYFAYPSFWIFIGTVFGLYLTIILYLIGTLSELSILDKNLSFDREQYDLIITHLHYPEVHVIVYVIGFLLSILYIVLLYSTAKKFKKMFIKKLTDLYKYDFPYVKIKTESGEIKGQLMDILNDLIILSENDILKTVQWDKIETMEVFQKNKEISSENSNFLTSSNKLS